MNNEEVVSRIAAKAFPLRSTVPDATPSDLDALKPCFENRSVIALGESTHGAREFFRVKHRLIRYLVTELDVRVLGLEMGFTGTLALDAYLLHGEGEPEEILDSFGWLARTEPFLDVVEWLREFNEDRPRSEQVVVYGIDIGSGTRSIDSVETYLQRVDSAFCGERDEQFETLRSYREWSDETGDRLTEDAETFESSLRRRFDAYEEEYAALSSREAWVHARHQLDVHRQAREYAQLNAEERWVDAREHRDRSMANNVDWVRGYEDADCVVIWAHDGHVRNGRVAASMSDPARTMGWYLSRRYGEEYYALGLEFGGGSFQAYADSEREDTAGLREWTIDEPRPGSLPAVFRRVGDDVFVLDVDRAVEDRQLADWLNQAVAILSIGGVFFENDTSRHYDQSLLRQEFDGLLFVDEITRARPLPE